MVGRSWHAGCPVGRDGLRLLRVNYVDFSGYRRRGELVVAAGAYAGFFGDWQRELLIVAGIGVLLWVPAVRLPRVLAPVVTTLAGASLFIYLTHWQVYPHLEMGYPLLALLSSLVVGVVYWWLTRPALRGLGAWLRRFPAVGRAATRS